MTNNLDTHDYSKRWYRVVYKKLFSIAFLKFALLIGVMILSWVLITYGEIPLDPSKLRAWVIEKGTWAPVILILINNLAIFNPFIPNQIIHITAGAMYGPIVGFLMIYPASLIGWSFNYYLGRKLGRGFVEEMIGKDTAAKLDDNVKKAKLKDFLILIFTPGTSYDVLGYIAGTVGADFKNFLLGGVIGAIIPTFITVTIGQIAVDIPWLGFAVTGIGIVFSIVYAIYIVKVRRHESN